MYTSGGLESTMDLTVLNQISAGLCFFPQSFSPESVFLCFPEFTGHLHSLAHGLHRYVTLPSASMVLSLSLTCCLSYTYKDTCDYTGPTKIIQYNLPNSRNLIMSTESLLSDKLTYF